MKKKLIAILLAGMSILSVSMPVQASELDSKQIGIVEPRYEAVSRVTSSIAVNTYTVSLSCSYRIKSLTDYDYELTMTLEKSSNKTSWDEVNSWSKTLTSSTGTFDKTYAVNSGYYYRTVTTIDVYTKNGKYVETADSTSAALYY